MHMNVYCSTVHNSKDLEPTQMPINDRLDKENVIHTHHGILCSHKKEQDHVLCRAGMERKAIILSKRMPEQKTKYCMFSLIGGWWTIKTHGHREGSTTHWGLLGQVGEGQWWGDWGEIAWGEMPDVGEGEEGSKSHSHVCTYATILHVLHMYPKT